MKPGLEKKMLFKELGKTGVPLPEIGMGTWHYHAGPEPLRAGLAAGARFIDTAESYGAETAVADAIAGQRDTVFVATKVSPAHFRRRDVLKAADGSLRRLRTDYIDLYQLHEPNGFIPMEETLGAMEELVDAGKVRLIGVSNFSVRQLQRACRAVRKHPVAANQVRFSLIDRTIVPDLLPYCQTHRITVIAYSPLGRKFQNIVDCDRRGALAEIARTVGRTAAQVALNWCLCRNGLVAIPKSNSVAHVLENCRASDWRLSPEQLRQLDEAILFRRRSGLEVFLRRYLPPELKRAVQRILRFAPGAARRRLN